MRRWAMTCAAALLAMAGAGAAAQSSPSPSASPATDFDAAGYRTERYRAPVTRDPAPATRLSLAAALLLHPGEDALFIDVLPAEGGVRDSRSGAWRLAQPHQTIPGAIWIPEAGRGSPDPVLWRALEVTVHRAGRRDPALPIVLFCRTDCWMGWNAARRLASGGVPGVWWLAEGIDGWHAAGRPLAEAVPMRVPE